LLGAGEGDEVVERESSAEAKPPAELGETIRLIRE